MNRVAALVGPATAGLRGMTGRAARGSAVVLGYHDVVATDAQAEGLTVSAPALRRHLRLTRRMGFRFVSVAEISRRVLAGESVDRLAAVVFDDALAGVTHHGVDVLLELDVPASLAVVSTMMGQRPVWWPGSGPTMTASELLSTVKAGLDVVAHTRTHASLPTLQNGQLAAELAGAKVDLESLLGRAVDLVAYPFGHHDERVRAEARAAGYLAGYTFLNGRIRGSEDPYKLPRFTMGAHHGPARLAYHLARSASSWPDHQDDKVVGEVAGGVISGETT